MIPTGRVLRLARRDVLVGAAALAGTLPFASAAFADPDRLWFSGDMTQGGFVLGRGPDGTQAWLNDEPVRVSDGIFCLGFGRDDTNPVAVRVGYTDGAFDTKTITPTRRRYGTERLDGLPQAYVTPPASVQARIARDVKVVHEARSHDTDGTSFMDRFRWPVVGPITGVYGSSRILNGRPGEPHYGTDIAAPAGTPVRAALDGMVTLADNLYIPGKTVILDHGHGVSTSYLHLSRIDVKPRHRVRQGDQIGLVGATGRATAPHVCWRLYLFHTPLDVALVAPPRPDKA